MSKQTQHQIQRSQASFAVTGLIDRPILQAVQDRFSEKYRVPSAVLDRDGDPITFERRQSPYCKEIRQTRAGYDLCRGCDRKLIELAHKHDGGRWCICQHGGLLDFAVPLLVGKKLVAYFFIGQIRGRKGRQRTSRVSEYHQRLLKRAKETGEQEEISLASLKKKYARIKVRTDDEIARIGAFAREFAKDLSCTLTRLEKWKRPRAVSQFLTKMARAGKVEELFDICVSEIPKLLGTNYCSIFTVKRGKKRAAPRLVLQRTNFKPSQNQEETKAYEQGEGLTGWVWKNARSLRLNNIKDKLELAKYPDLEWSNSITDSDHHKEWLGVPLFGWRGDVVGVIRVPEKKRIGTSGGVGFSFEDEVLLLTIGKHVASQIEELPEAERIRTALVASQKCAVRLGGATNPESVAAILVTTCKQIFGVAGKIHAFIMPSEDRTKFIVKVSAGSLRQMMKSEFPAQESLAGLALRKGGAVIINDVQAAARKKQYYPAVTALACAISAPVCFGDNQYGVLSVGSDRKYEFSEEPDLHIVRDLASIAGATLARLEAERESEAAFITFSEEMGHTLMSRVATLEITIAAIRNEGGAEQVAAIADEIDDTVEFLKRTAKLGVRLGQTRGEVGLAVFQLSDVIIQVEKHYRHEPVDCSVRGSLMMIGEPEMIEDVLIELIENSLRLTPGRNRRVSVRAFRKRRGSDMSRTQRGIVIEVRDNGPGVPKDQKEAIFQPYRTCDDSRPGLGLSVVKSVVEVHGGHIDERGRPGRGACFRIVFPEIEE